MGINAGSFVSPIITGWLASTLTHTPLEQNYRSVFAAAGVGMVISFIWFWFGRRQLKGIGRPPANTNAKRNLSYVFVYMLFATPIVYFLLARLGANALAWILGVLFLALA